MSVQVLNRQLGVAHVVFTLFVSALPLPQERFPSARKQTHYS